MKINPRDTEMAMFLTCEAIGKDRSSDIRPDENGEIDLTILINGKEVDAARFIDSLEESYHTAVQKAANEIVSEKYSNVLGQVYEIQDLLENQKLQLFSSKYEQLQKMCRECDEYDCAYCVNKTCKFPMVYEDEPLFEEGRCCGKVEDWS